MTIDHPFQTVSLGPRGPVVSALGIGTWAWGDSLFWNYGRDYGANDVQQAFQAAIDTGIRFFDTAEVYGFGESERLLGSYTQSTPQTVVLATKYFPLPWRWSPQAVSKALTASLQRLQQSTIALYQVHWPLDFWLGQDRLMEALADEVQRGRIQAVGVSNYSTQQMCQAHALLAKRGIPLAVNQVQFSLLHRQPKTTGLLRTAQDLQITVLAYSPLAQGLLTGKYRSSSTHPPTGARRLDPRFKPSRLAKLQPVLQALQTIGIHHQQTPAQVALNWLIAHGNVMPIPGAKTAEQALQNAGALGWQITATEQEHLDQVAQDWLAGAG